MCVSVIASSTFVCICLGMTSKGENFVTQSNQLYVCQIGRGPWDTRLYFVRTLVINWLTLCGTTDSLGWGKGANAMSVFLIPYAWRRRSGPPTHRSDRDDSACIAFLSWKAIMWHSMGMDCLVRMQQVKRGKVQKSNFHIWLCSGQITLSL